MCEEKLFDAVRSFPCLWNTKEKCYKDQRARGNAWKEVESLVSICNHGIDLDTSLII